MTSWLIEEGTKSKCWISSPNILTIRMSPFSNCATITDFTPPVSDNCVQEYEQWFRYDHVDKSRSTLVRVVVCVVKSKQTVRKKPRRRRKTQKGGLSPLESLIPALVAAGKAAALGGISGAASHKSRRWKIIQRTKDVDSEAEHGLDVSRIRDNSAVHCWLFSRVRQRSGTSSERTRGIREWVQRVSPAVTTDVWHRGKYDSIMQTTTFLGGYSKRDKSEQETGDVRTC